MGDYIKRDDIDPKLEMVIIELKTAYDEAKKLSFINNPVAYALYHVWKKHDKTNVTRKRK